ncbi:MAG: metal-binding protein [Patescibacteria group bacterium]|nr:metal-binding protein [Patescibacteria group bacterium]
MPNGKTHDKITYITTPIITLGTIFFTNITWGVIMFFSYLFSSMMFNGDLDTNSRPYNRWWIFKIIWIPYQLLFLHRSIWTHGFLIGTIIRILYIMPIIILIFISLNISIKVMDYQILLLIFIGLELGNSIHTLSDKIF